MDGTGVEGDLVDSIIARNIGLPPSWIALKDLILDIVECPYRGLTNTQILDVQGSVTAEEQETDVLIRALALSIGVCSDEREDPPFTHNSRDRPKRIGSVSDACDLECWWCSCTCVGPFIAQLRRRNQSLEQQ